MAAGSLSLEMASANREDDSIGGFRHQNNAGLSPQDPKITVEQAHGLVETMAVICFWLSGAALRQQAEEAEHHLPRAAQERVRDLKGRLRA